MYVLQGVEMDGPAWGMRAGAGGGAEEVSGAPAMGSAGRTRSGELHVGVAAADDLRSYVVARNTPRPSPAYTGYGPM
jgi:hypothetical protein